MAARSSRRKFLRKLAAGLPALAAGGALAHTGVLVAKGKNGSKFPGDAAVWRSKFLDEARAEKGGAAVVDIIDAPVRPTDLPMVMDISRGPIAVAPPPADVTAKPADMVRMQDELKRAMEKPIDQRKWIMVIDLQKCIGCSACTVACKAENHLPPGIVYRPVIEEEIGEYPNVTRRWLPRPCMQCEDPPCTDVCPVNATWKREDGIVVIDYNRCIGCRYCLTACPYGARYFDFGEDYSDGTPARQPYEEEPSPEYGREWTRDGQGSPVGNARKCQFCIHRLEAGMLPACVTTCVGGATYFGDKNDPDSFVSELIGSPRVMRLKEEQGTNPKVYYLV
ncbi:MAG TPA: 4Fe-4S dicluster domain-containing protein [Dehalococcoidia bacterium]|nr:4Fe-4S dicluster domain-containing protein [Dehalococcoidia bacterium]